MQSCHGGFVGFRDGRSSMFSGSSTWYPDRERLRAHTDIYMMFGDRLTRVQVEILPFPSEGIDRDRFPKRDRELKYSLTRFLMGDGDLRTIPFVYRSNERVGQENVVYPIARLYFGEEIPERLPKDIRDELRKNRIDL